jgi:hypothetical protein
MPQPPPAADFREPTFMVPILAKEILVFFSSPLPVRCRIYKAEPVFPDSPAGSPSKQLQTYVVVGVLWTPIYPAFVSSAASDPPCIYIPIPPLNSA